MTTNPEDGVNYTGVVGKGTETPTLDLKSKLSSNKMKDLQELGETYGVKDNIKTELVDKILAKASDDHLKEYLGVKEDG